MAHSPLLPATILLLASSLAEAANGSEHAHPLDPLSAEEITTTVELVKTRHGKPSDILFPMVSLQEPTKDEMAQYESGKAIPRRGFALIYDQKKSLLIEAVFDLKANNVLASQSGRIVHLERGRIHKQSRSGVVVHPHSDSRSKAGRMAGHAHT